MHELGIITGVVQSAEVEAVKNGASKVISVVLAVGEMSEAFEDSLQFSYEILCPGTMLEGSTLEIISVPPKAYVWTAALNLFTNVMSACAHNALVPIQNLLKVETYLLNLSRSKTHKDNFPTFDSITNTRSQNVKTYRTKPICICKK